MGSRKIFQAEILFDFILIALGAVVMVISLAYGFGTFRRPGPGLYPFFIGLGIFLFSTALLIAGLRSPNSAPLFGSGGTKIFLFMIAAFCLWIIVMPVLGYVPVTFLATAAFAKIMKLEGWWKPLAVSAGTALFIYLLFDYGLYIDLPRGILE